MAALKQEVAVLEEALAPDVMSRPLDELAAPEALGRAALSGIRQMIRIIEQPLDMEDLKQQRLIGDISVAAGKLYMRAAEGAFKARQAGALDKLLEMLEIERAEKKESEGG